MLFYVSRVGTAGLLQHGGGEKPLGGMGLKKHEGSK